MQWCQRRARHEGETRAVAGCGGGWISGLLQGNQLTLLMSSRSWARLESNQKIAGLPVARARATASRTQSLIGASFVWHMRQMSPASTVCSNTALPSSPTTRIVPGADMMKVLSCDPYSSAFWAIKPTLLTLPMVATSNCPYCLQNDMISVDTRAAVRWEGGGCVGLRTPGVAGLALQVVN